MKFVSPDFMDSVGHLAGPHIHSLFGGLLGWFFVDSHVKAGFANPKNLVGKGGSMTNCSRSTRPSPAYTVLPCGVGCRFTGGSSGYEMGSGRDPFYLNNGCTFATWIQMTSVSGGGTFYEIFSPSISEVRFYLLQQSGVWKRYNSLNSSSSATTNLTHLVYTFNPTSGPNSGIESIYLNGKLDATRTGAIAALYGPANAVIGGSTSYSTAINGTMHDTRIYDRHLSPAEVLALYRREDIVALEAVVMSPMFSGGSAPPAASAFRSIGPMFTRSGSRKAAV
jgi:hypothetical protein